MNVLAPRDAPLAWRQLLRLGNVFSAASNVIAGWLIARGDWGPTGALALLALGSMLMYAAGMALNDAFDAQRDAELRPERPIPSGRISRGRAFAAGWTLLAGGLVASAASAVLLGRLGPVIVACCLAVMIVLYDAGLKATWAGPWAMAWCRVLNVLLGGCLAETNELATAAGVYAVSVGLYTAGLTMLATREAGQPPRGHHRWGKETLAVACGLLFAWPWTMVGLSATRGGPLAASIGLFAVAMFAALQGGRAARALNETAIRAAVSRLIVGFILIDACAATAAAGWVGGAAVLTLLAPTALAARRAPMT